jgi:uncharacterized protein DUF397
MSINDAEEDNLQWRKSRWSAGNGACVEVAPLGGGVAVRDSKDPQGPTLSCSPDVWRSFLAVARRTDLN